MSELEVQNNGEIIGLVSLVREAALKYLRRGLSVIPINPTGKKPFVKWKPYQTSLPTEAEINYWWTKWPNANVGIVTGSLSGIVILDVDGVDAMKLLEGRDLPPTVSVMTREDRYQYWYRHPGKRIKNFTNILGNDSHVDIRADGGYAVIPPSVHPETNKPYRWLNNLSIDDIEIADMPQWLIDITRAGDHKGKSTRKKSRALQETTNQSVVSCNALKYGYTSTDNQSHRDKITNQLYCLCAWEAVAYSMLRKYGRQVNSLNTAFCCIIPEHEEEHPSATLFRDENDYRQRGDKGVITYHDFHREGAFYLLPEVYAAVESNGRTKRKVQESGDYSFKMPRAMVATWTIRMLHDLKFISLPSIRALKLPVNAPKGAKKVYDGFVYLMRVRAYYDPTQAGAPYSWQFASEWCDISKRTPKNVLPWLIANGYMLPVNNSKRAGDTVQEASLFRLGTTGDITRKQFFEDVNKDPDWIEKGWGDNEAGDVAINRQDDSDSLVFPRPLRSPRMAQETWNSG